MQSTRITLRIRGRDDDDGDVRFDDFLKQLNAWRNALTETERSLFDNKPSVYFKVVDLRRQSPASIVLEAVSRDPARDIAAHVVDKFFTSMQQIEKGIPPEGLTFAAYQAFKQVPSLVGKQITEMVVSRNGDSLPITNAFATKIDELLGPDEYEYGAVTGMLEQINVHANQNVFTIYPTSQKPKVRCVFPQELRRAAVSAVDQYVRVRGLLKYKRQQRFAHPYEIVVEQIEVYPPEEDLPTLSQLRGIAPNAGDNTSSEEFIGRMRDGW